MTCIAAVICTALLSQGGNWPEGKLKLPAVVLESGKSAQAPHTSPIRVFLFLGVECPIANRYAPEIQRIHKQFAAKNVQFIRVYMEKWESVSLVRNHTKEYKYAFPFVLDPEKQLVKAFNVRVTPEVAVLNASNELLYRGRIDNRNIDHGKVKEGFRRDLIIALEEILAGKPVTERSTAAIGCFIGN